VVSRAATNQSGSNKGGLTSQSRIVESKRVESVNAAQLEDEAREGKRRALELLARR
jgi:hypothetical protein